MADSISHNGPLQKSDWNTVLFLCVLTASLAGNVFQGLRLRATSISNNHAFSVITEKQIGQIIPSLTVSTSSGTPQVLGLQGQQTVLYVFSPDCHWCARNLPNILSLSHNTGSRYRFIGIVRSVNQLPGYIAVSKLTFPVYVDSNAADFKKLDFFGTPQTIVLKPDGTVVHNWPGAYTGLTEREVSSYFSVTLPGLVAQ